MKTGNNISGERILFKKGKQRKLFLTIKEYYQITWKELALKLNISEWMVRQGYRNEKATIPLKLLKELLNHYPLYNLNFLLEKWSIRIIKENLGQVKGGFNSSYSSKPSRKYIKIPTYSKNLAEFIGIILGDGHISKKGVIICSEFPLEKQYQKRIICLIKNLFKINPSLSFRKHNKNVRYIVFYSKKVVESLNKMGLPSGNKLKNQIKIPEWILKDKIYLAACLKGLIDTDGGIYHKQIKYDRALIEFQSNIFSLRNDINTSLENLGFTTSKGKNAVRIQKQEEIHKFFQIINPSNPKHILRYEIFLKTKKVPNIKDIRSQITNYNLRQ